MYTRMCTIGSILKLLDSAISSLHSTKHTGEIMKYYASPNNHEQEKWSGANWEQTAQHQKA